MNGVLLKGGAYIDLNGRELALANLDEEELQLARALLHRAEADPDWDEFDNFWMNAIAALYDGRGIPRTRSRQTTLYKIAQDLSARLAIAAGRARAPDYRDQLEELIRTRFKNRREFCEATGLSEDMLSHVLARRKHLSIDKLVQALRRIGCDVQIISPSPRASVCPFGRQEAISK